MGVSVAIQKQVLNFDENKKTVYVAKAQRSDVITSDKIAKYVAQDTGARPAQVKMILGYFAACALHRRHERAEVSQLHTMPFFNPSHH